MRVAASFACFAYCACLIAEHAACAGDNSPVFRPLPKGKGVWIAKANAPSGVRELLGQQKQLLIEAIPAAKQKVRAIQTELNRASRSAKKEVRESVPSLQEKLIAAKAEQDGLLAGSVLAYPQIAAGGPDTFNGAAVGRLSNELSFIRKIDSTTAECSFTYSDMKTVQGSFPPRFVTVTNTTRCIVSGIDNSSWNRSVQLNLPVILTSELFPDASGTKVNLPTVRLFQPDEFCSWKPK